MNLREKVYQTFIMHYRDLKGISDYKEFFEKYPIGGLYFSKGPAPDLVEGVEGEARTSQDFVHMCRQLSKYPMVVCADGANIDDGLNAPDPRSLAAADSESLCYDLGKAYGMQMNYNDVDWILGPCIDMSKARLNFTISAQAAEDEETTAKVFTNVVKGIQSQNVAATVKHFPGIGTDFVNMHATIGRNVMPFDKWMKTYGYTYKEMFKAGAMSVMTSHITLESYSKKADYGTAPIATYSKDLTLKLLKDELGFDGVVVTDALTMGGCATGDMVEQSVAAFASGADYLLWPPVEAGERIIEELENGNIPMSRLDDAIERIERFKKRLKITDSERPKCEVDAKWVDQKITEVTQKGLTLARNELNNIPLDKNRKNVFLSVITPESRHARFDAKMELAEDFKKKLENEGFNVTVQANLVQFDNGKIAEMREKYDYMIFLCNEPYTLERNECFNAVWTTHMFPREKTIVINYQTPYMVDDYFPTEKTVIQVNNDFSELTNTLIVNALTGKTPLTGKFVYKTVKL